MQLDHEKLDVYQAALEFTLLMNKIIKELPKGNSHLADQALRASTSIQLNIAEGGGEFSKNEKVRFYRIARRSATECAAILDIFQRLNLIEKYNQGQSRELLIRIISMLTKMVK